MLDETTLQLPKTAKSRGAKPVVALTCVCHPDLRRWGDTALVGEGGVEVSRGAPLFVPPAAAEEAMGLDIPYLSRRPLVAIEGDIGGVAVRAVHERAEVVLNGSVLNGSARLNAAELERGALIEIDEQVGLWLHLREAAPRSYDDHGLIGVDPAMEHLREQIDAVSSLVMSVLIRGETGTGKERVAAALHAASPRASREMLAVNVAAVDPSVLASELFGHVRGAFTGASGARKGYFRQAEGSTLFLDEIGDAGAEVQRALLRALETREVIPVGADRPVPVDVRVIAATDADLEAGVVGERFRAPLLHRLAQFEIRVPPLRERKMDIPVLFAAFVLEQLRTLGAPLPDRSAPAWVRASTVRRLMRHRWPGNVRELRNVAGAAVVRSLGDESLTLPPLAKPGPDTQPAASPGKRTDLDAISDDTILAALSEHAWRPEPAAKALGIARSSLYQRMKAHPEIPNSSELSEERIATALEEAAGDTHAAAAALRVPQRGLLHRMKKLGLR